MLGGQHKVKLSRWTQSWVLQVSVTRIKGNSCCILGHSQIQQPELLAVDSTSLGNHKALGLTPSTTYTNSCVQVQLQATVDQSQRMTLVLATRTIKESGTVLLTTPSLQLLAGCRVPA